jgi:hypothetical protein
VGEGGLAASFAILTPLNIGGLLLMLPSLGTLTASLIVLLGSLPKTVREAVA